MRRAPLAALLGLTATLFVAAASCGDGAGEVGLGEARRATVVEIVDAPATVTAKAAVTLTAPAEGTVATLAVRPGDQVGAGQVLAVIDSPAARSRLSQADAALRAAKQAGGGVGRGVDLSGLQRATDAAAAAAFTAARDAASKISDPGVRDALLAQVTVAEKHYAQVSTAAAQAVRGVQQGIAAVGSALSALGTAQRLQAQQAYDLAKSTVDSLTLRAPFAGVVQLGGTASAPAGGQSLTDLLGAVSGGAAAPATGSTPTGVSDAVGVGATVGAGTPVATIVDVSELTLVAEVDETDVLLVAPGVTARIELDAATGAEYGATVRSVDVLPTPSARGGVAYRVRLTLEAGKFPDGRAAPQPRPGMSAVAHLSVREAVDAITVPAAAVFTSEGGDAVWLVRDGAARRVPVTVGVSGQDLVQLTAGVSAGDRVVVRGTDKVRSGQKLP